MQNIYFEIVTLIAFCIQSFTYTNWSFIFPKKAISLDLNSIGLVTCVGKNFRIYD